MYDSTMRIITKLISLATQKQNYNFLSYIARNN